jgi:plastocyanin
VKPVLGVMRQARRGGRCASGRSARPGTFAAFVHLTGETSEPAVQGRACSNPRPKGPQPVTKRCWRGCAAATRRRRELDLVLAATNARAEVVQVRIEKPAFVPAQVTAHGGDAVEWVNADFVAHTATARDGAWDVLIPVDGARSVVLKAPGKSTITASFTRT